MKAKFATVGALAASTLALVCSPAWGGITPVRDAGDAAATRFPLKASPIGRDSGDATGARLEQKAARANKSRRPVEVVRDAGDAMGARLGLRAAPASEQGRIVVTRDAGDATAARNRS